MDTDYDRFLIEVKCLPSVNFALTNKEELEPVHMITVNIWTRSPKSDPDLMKEVEAIVKRNLDDQIDFTTILHSEDDEDVCHYSDFKEIRKQEKKWAANSAK